VIISTISVLSKLSHLPSDFSAFYLHYPAIAGIMAARTFSALLAVSATAVAQQTTWGSVVFTYHGEKTPTLNNGPYNLSPLGASQLYLAGQAIRERYISPPNNGSVITDPAPINGISKDAIDNSQLDILSTDDEFISASGLAFMQGQ
jgi:hypothetical protein